MAGPPPIAANNPLLNPNAPLSGPALVQAAQALAQAQTAGPLQELAKQIAQNNSQNSGALNQIGGYFNQLGQLGQQGVTDQQGIASGLNAQLAQIARDEQGQLGQIGTNATSSLLKYSPQSDQTTTNPGLSGLTAEIARQQGLAAQQQGAFRSFGATQGANQGGLAASNLGTIGLRGQEDLKNIAQAGQVRNEPLMAKVADLQATTGVDFATALGKLRQQEITNQITQAGLGIKAQANQISAQNNQRTNATSAANNQRTTSTSAANNAATNAQSNVNNQRTNSQSAANNAANNATRVALANSKTGAGATKPLTPQQNLNQLTDLNKVQAAIQTWQQQGIKDSKGNVLEAHPTDAQMRQVLGGKYNPILVDAAFELLGWGHITPATAAQMHNSGIRGGTFRGQPIAVAPPPAAPAPTQLGNLAPIGQAVQGAIGGAVHGLGG